MVGRCWSKAYAGWFRRIGTRFRQDGLEVSEQGLDRVV